MFKVELQKILTNIAFYLAIASAVMLLLLGNIYVSSMTGEEYTVIDLIIDDNRSEIIKEADLYTSDVITGDISSYLEMFVPVIVAIPFVIIVCGEKKNSNARFELYRIGKNRFILGKYFADMVAGGMVIMIAYMIFSLIISFILPSGEGIISELRNEFLTDENVIAGFLHKSCSIKGLYIYKFLRMFLYGAVSVLPAFALSMVTKNRYIIISMPFMFYYLLGKFITKQASEKLGYFLPNTVGNIYATDVLRLIIIYVAEALLVIVFCRIYLGRKCDCGEE